MRKNNKPRLLFFHSEVRSYRVPLFELLNENYDVTFIFLHQTHYALSTPEASKWRYTYLKPKKLPGYSADACPSVVSYLLKNRHNYDVVIFSGIFSFATHIGLPLAKFLGKKTIIWDETWVLPKNFNSKIISPYLKFLIHRADALIEAGSRTREFYIKMGANQAKCFMAPNCAENILPLLDTQLAKQLSQKLGITANQVVIGYLGRVVRYKALDTLIEGFCTTIRPKFPNARLLIVGDGPYSAKCREVVGKYSDQNIIWIGGDAKKVEPVSHAEFVNYLSLVDIFVLPGRFVWAENVPAESWGLTLNEAMSLGKPVVSTRSVAAAYDLIENENNGYLIREDNVPELSSSLIKLVSNNRLRLDAGVKSREIIKQKYNYEKMFHGFAQAISYSKSK